MEGGDGVVLGIETLFVVIVVVGSLFLLITGWWFKNRSCYCERCRNEFDKEDNQWSVSRNGELKVDKVCDDCMHIWCQTHINPIHNKGRKGN